MIYKILTLDEYAFFIENKKFIGNPLDLKDGFMHFSTKEQYRKIIDKYFLGQKIVVLEIDSSKIKGNLKFERNISDGEKYPHLYDGYIGVEEFVSVVYAN